MERRLYERYVERATANVGRGGATWWTIAAVLAVLVALGVYAYAYQVQNGHGVTGVNHTVFWGLYIVNFVFFIGISYGGAITSAILRLTGAKWRAPITRIAEGTAVVTLAVGAVSVIVDVARPDRILNLVLRAQPGSPITWDWIAINPYLAGTVTFFALPLIPALGQDRDPLPAGSMRARIYGALALRWQGTPAQERWLLRAIGIMAVLIIPLAVSVHSVLAWLFAVTVRDSWHSTIFAPYFVVAAMLSGVATVILTIALLRKAHGLEEFITAKHFRYLSYMLIALAAAYLYFVIAEDLTEGYTQVGSSGELLLALFTGPYAPVFWSSVVGGLVLPIVLVALPGRTLAIRASIASLLVVGAMWLKRYLIVVAPGIPTSASLFAEYRPTWVELAITVGSFAAIPLGLMVLFRFFPVMSIHELEEVEELTPQPERHGAALPVFGGGDD